MTTSDCIAKAQACEALAQVVSYGRDKTDILAEAARWRMRAETASEAPGSAPEPMPAPPAETWVDRLVRAVRLRR